jgi:hypothetical protein
MAPSIGRAARSIWIPSHPPRGMGSGWRHVLRIWLAQAAEPACRRHALIERHKSTICATTGRAAAVNGAPWIVLRLSAISNADETDANSHDEKQEPHGRLLEPLGTDTYARALFPVPRGDKPLAATVGWLRGQVDQVFKLISTGLARPNVTNALFRYVLGPCRGDHSGATLHTFFQHNAPFGCATLRLELGDISAV